MVYSVGMRNTRSAHTQLYYVDEDQADDPEATSHSLMSAAEIKAAYPFFASLITGDGSESLTYVHELNRWQITPAGE
jgi:hypothetical protein